MNILSKSMTPIVNFSIPNLDWGRRFSNIRNGRYNHNLQRLQLLERGETQKVQSVWLLSSIKQAPCSRHLRFIHSFTDQKVYGTIVLVYDVLDRKKRSKTAYFSLRRCEIMFPYLRSAIGNVTGPIPEEVIRSRDLFLFIWSSISML